MKFDVVMFFLFFGAATSASAATYFILLTMVNRINRKRDYRSQIPTLGFSWPQVWREYGLVYPNGRYRRALAGAAVLAIAFALISFFWLFGVLPRYAVPSR